MNYPEAFLAVTAVAYFTAVFMPKRFQKPIPLPLEKLSYVLLGSLIIASIYLNINEWWLGDGIIFVIASLLAYGKMVDWGSTEQNLFMAFWDLTVAVVCISKAFL